jgi:epoxyqueuosine reductase
VIRSPAWRHQRITPTLISKPDECRSLLQQLAAREEIPVFRITTTTLDAQVGERLQQFVGEGFHGDMGWMEERQHERASPDHLWPDAKRAVVFALPYGQELDPFARLEQKTAGVISVYALNRDYHDVFKGKLKRLAQDFAAKTGSDVKVFVDTAPVMEKPLAAQAGLGWQGRHTNLVSRELGSWFFLGVMLTTADLPIDEPERDHCGTCRACLDVCPTHAFLAPYQLDAQKCISYLTIEHKSHIELVYRKAMGNRIYGCDDCLAVCPWNKFAQAAADAKLKAREDLIAPTLADLLRLDDLAFRKLFPGSPVKRIGRDRFIRNCLIAAGNSGDQSLIANVEALLSDSSPLVRAMAVWALSVLDQQRFETVKAARRDEETDKAVMQEWMR